MIVAVVVAPMTAAVVTAVVAEVVMEWDGDVLEQGCAPVGRMIGTKRVGCRRMQKQSD